MEVYKIISALGRTTKSTEKIKILEANKDNKLLKRVLKMTYDKLLYKYYIKKIPLYTMSNNVHLNEVLDNIENKICTRNITGDAAILFLKYNLELLSSTDAYIIECLIERDLKVGINTSIINKVFPSLITETPYMRCDVYSKKTSKNIKFPAIVQEKCDGRFCYAYKRSDDIDFISRSGESQEFPIIKDAMKDYKDGVYVGELRVKGLDNRSEGNGLINSSNPPHKDIYITLWDYIEEKEFLNPKDKNDRKAYKDRFNDLKSNIKFDEYIMLVNYREVKSLKEALEFTSDIMNQGGEGSVLKDYSNIFATATSKTQLKLKLQIDAEVRCTGFTPGTGKRALTFGSMTFENDEGTIKGKTSGFGDDQLIEIHNNRDKYVGKVFTIQFNDISKAQGNDHYAFMHPRFIEFRDDKDETDTLEKVFALKEMAMELM